MRVNLKVWTPILAVCSCSFSQWILHQRQLFMISSEVGSDQRWQHLHRTPSHHEAKHLQKQPRVYFADRAAKWRRWLRQGGSTPGSGRALWVTWPGKALCQHGGVIGVSKVKRSWGVCVFACVPAWRWMNFPSSIKAHLLFSQYLCGQKSSCLYPPFTFVVKGNNMSYPN